MKNAIQNGNTSKKNGAAVFLRAMFSRRVVIIGVAGFLIFLLAAIFADVLTPYEPSAMSITDILSKPSPQHLLGTDQFGRDTLARLLHGTRVSLIVGVFATALACVVGVLLGLAAAYFGGGIDSIIMRCSEALVSIPRIMLSLALIVILGNTIADLAIILAIPTIPTYVRMMRSTALQTKNSDFVKVAQIQGIKSLPIIFRHVLPNSVSPIIIMMMQNVGQTILLESGLSFLGIGITIPIASWGSMVNEAKTFLLTNPLLAVAPGLCVALLVICLNLIGDGLRDAMDPRLRDEV